jgi:hypothetical protein
MGKPIDGEGVADAESAGHVAFVATVVLDKRADVSPVNAVWRHAMTFVRCDVEDDTGARGASLGQSRWTGDGCRVCRLVQIFVSLLAWQVLRGLDRIKLLS